MFFLSFFRKKSVSDSKIIKKSVSINSNFSQKVVGPTASELTNQNNYISVWTYEKSFITSDSGQRSLGIELLCLSRNKCLLCSVLFRSVQSKKSVFSLTVMRMLHISQNIRCQTLYLKCDCYVNCRLLQSMPGEPDHVHVPTGSSYVLKNKSALMFV